MRMSSLIGSISPADEIALRYEEMRPS